MRLFSLLGNGHKVYSFLMRSEYGPFIRKGAAAVHDVTLLGRREFLVRILDSCHTVISTYNLCFSLASNIGCLPHTDEIPRRGSATPHGVTLLGRRKYPSKNFGFMSHCDINHTICAFQCNGLKLREMEF